MPTLNYIGSKSKLLPWVCEKIDAHTGFGTDGWQGHTFADLFSGTASVASAYRAKGARVIANDAELYASVIAHAIVRSQYSPKLNNIMITIDEAIDDNLYLQTAGFITRNYSPFEGSERMYFTVDNAQRIDYARQYLENIASTLTEDEYKYILATIICSADQVANTASVYGAYLKQFKATANQPFYMIPVHINSNPCDGVVHNTAAGNLDIHADAVYIDPPYNERQYSKNYFVLNVIAMKPSEQAALPPLKGKTGIPEDCYLSPFCQKKNVDLAFRALVAKCHARWVFISYNSESLLSRAKMVELLEHFGTVTVEEKVYKKFKSSAEVENAEVTEYLFCLEQPPQ
jgi:adenine-specific DNA-methyltransferase